MATARTNARKKPISTADLRALEARWYEAQIAESRAGQRRQNLEADYYELENEKMQLELRFIKNSPTIWKFTKALRRRAAGHEQPAATSED